MEDCFQLIMSFCDPYTAYNISIITKVLYNQVKRYKWYESIIYLNKALWRSEYNNLSRSQLRSLLQVKGDKDPGLTLDIYANLLSKNRSFYEITEEHSHIVLRLFDCRTVEKIITYNFKINNPHFTVDLIYKLHRFGFKNKYERVLLRLDPFYYSVIPIEFCNQYKTLRVYLKKCYYLDEVPEDLKIAHQRFLTIFKDQPFRNFVRLVDEYCDGKLSLHNCEQILSEIAPMKANMYINVWKSITFKHELNKLPPKLLISDENYEYLTEVYLKTVKERNYYVLEGLNLSEEDKETCSYVMQKILPLTAIKDVKLRYYIDGYLRDDIKAFSKQNLEDEFRAAALDLDWEFMIKYIDVVEIELLREIREIYIMMEEDSVCGNLINEEINKRK